jgi:hypothetical protein
VPTAGASSAGGLLFPHLRLHRLRPALHAATQTPAERGNSLLEATLEALRRVSLHPWLIGAITAAALVLLHHENRTT